VRGRDAALKSDAKETVLKQYTTRANIINSGIILKGAIHRKTPRPVATPFPPLNFRKRG
jgi:hypothetical protein